MDKKMYIDALTKHATDNGRPYEAALADFLDYLLQLHDVKAFNGPADSYAAWMREMYDRDGMFFLLSMVWFNDVAEAMERGQWLDVFGILYEELYLMRGKASHTGQFFTPQSVSDLMADVIDSAKNQGTVNDCAAGSGRLLLAHYMTHTQTDREAGRAFTYVAQDSDPTACKMCALNMMAHGMRGRVLCQDTLAMSVPAVIYHINEVRYPIPSPYYSIRQELPEDNKE